MPTKKRKLKIPDITAAIEKLYASKIRPYPVQSIWASKIAHPCRRFLVYEQTHWNTKAPITAKLEMRFSLGNLHGTKIIRDMQDAFEGVDSVSFEQMEVPVPPNEFGISGRIDSVLVLRGEGRKRDYVPVEIKTMAESVFIKVRSLRDMLQAQHLYLRMYPGQLMTYMHFAECEAGIFVLRNKSSGEYRHFVVEYDPVYMKRLLDTASVVTEAVRLYRLAQSDEEELSRLPARIDWTRDVCGRCDHLATCLPDMSQAPGIVDRLGDLELATMLDVRDVTAGTFAAYEKADASIQKHVAGLCDDLAIGESRSILAPSHTITVTAGKRKGYKIPEKVKEKYAVDARTLRKKIEKTEGATP